MRFFNCNYQIELAATLDATAVCDDRELQEHSHEE